jgi:outer membrane protein OmpA-like peptidoglycan-associated protein
VAAALVDPHKEEAMSKRLSFQGLALAAAVALVAAGCATKKYVTEEVGKSEAKTGERVAGVETQVESAQGTLREHEEKIATTSKTAQEALDRAIAAGKLAEGKLLFETVLTDDKVKFGFDKTELSDEAKAALDAFSAQLKQENKNVYVEIQGHTDAIGSEGYNMRLGEQRAEAVRRYLNQNGGLPLHRMAVISYGESAPVTTENSRAARAQNRRVVLVVLS